MNATKQLHDLGQSLWLDNITRGLLTSGTLARYIRDFAVTGLTSDPTIFEQAIGNTGFYDEASRRKAGERESGEGLFFGLALEDLTRAADLFRPVHDATGGVDGWASLEVSPLLANDAAHTIEAAARLHALAARPNLFIKIPGTPEGISAIEGSIFAGVPLLSFAEHGEVKQALPTDGGDAEAVLAECRRAGIDDAALAARLQRDGADAFGKSWHQLLQRIAAKTDPLFRARAS